MVITILIWMMNRSKHRRKKSAAQKYSFVVDGKTEIWYLQMMKKNENIRHIAFKPELPKRKSLSDLYKIVVENSLHYDQVFWIVDFDTILMEHKRSKTDKSTINRFIEYLEKIKKMDNVSVIINFPCLEYWYLLYFKHGFKYIDNCDKIISELENTPISDYNKSERYYKKNYKDIYQRLKPYLENAKLNAKIQPKFNILSPNSTFTQMHEIFEFLKI